MAAGAHLALATLVAGDGLSFIVGAVALFGIGRVCFLVGYPMGACGRAFGMVLTVIPTMAAYGLAAYLIGRAVIAQVLT